MKPGPTKGATHNFVKPHGWDAAAEGECGTLSIRYESPGKRPHYYSTWHPSAEELAKLIVGAPVVLVCVGVQPPVAVDVGLVPSLKDAA
jgi:hypothetical protein